MSFLIRYSNIVIYFENLGWWPLLVEYGMCLLHFIFYYTSLFYYTLQYMMCLFNESVMNFSNRKWAFSCNVIWKPAIERPGIITHITTVNIENPTSRRLLYNWFPWNKVRYHAFIRK